MSGQSSIGERFVAAYSSADAAALAALYAPNAVCDVNVPQWRFALRGPAEIEEVLRTVEFQPGFHLVSHATRPTEDGAVVETEGRFQSEGEEHLVRELHLLRELDGQIIEHVLYCTGIWDAETIRTYQGGQSQS